MRYGLAAHRRHRRDAAGALCEWARRWESLISVHGIQFEAVEGVASALAQAGLLRGNVLSLGSGRDGGLMRMVSRVCAGSAGTPALDGVIFLVDPVDPSSVYPEAQALKRQSIIHGKPYVSTLAGAHEWMEVEAILSAPGEVPADIAWSGDPRRESIALIAHDAKKASMLEFAASNFDYLSLFQTRYATGTTGRYLNQLAIRSGFVGRDPWVTPVLSGPMGGDAQVAELVLDNRCQRVVFFEDPHVARQHEADIQLLDRSVCTAGDVAAIYHSREMADRWIRAASLRRQESLTVGPSLD